MHHEVPELPILEKRVCNEPVLEKGFHSISADQRGPALLDALLQLVQKLAMLRLEGLQKGVAAAVQQRLKHFLPGELLTIPAFTAAETQADSRPVALEEIFGYSMAVVGNFDNGPVEIAQVRHGEAGANTQSSISRRILTREETRISGSCCLDLALDAASRP